MSMTETGKNRRVVRWAIPGVALVFGIAYLVAGLIGDNKTFGIFGLGVMVVTGLLFLVLTRWSETAAGLRDRKDERINQLDREASLVSGMVVLLAVLVMFVVEIAQGKDGLPYSALGALGGVAYLVALVVLRYRR
jgi:predicted histidine transporter YuiF (NhaC family)